jgi:methionine biosynthesis protein MetW
MSNANDLSIKNYYDKRWIDAGVYSHSSGPRVFRVMEAHIRPETQCLDVGCGDSHVLGPWISKRASKYIGVDISENAVSNARAKGLDARIIEDAAMLPFHECVFDMVVCVEVLEHLFQPLLAAQEILRVLRPGGVLIATVPNLTHWRHRLLFFVAGRWDPRGDALSVEQPWRDPHIRFFNQTTLHRMLHCAGFVQVQVIGEEPSRLRRVPGVGEMLAHPKSACLLPTCFSHNLIAAAFKPSLERGSV